MSVPAAIALAQSAVGRISAAIGQADVNKYQAELQASIEELRTAFCRTGLDGSQAATVRADRQGIGAMPLAGLALVVAVDALFQALPSGVDWAPADLPDVEHTRRWLDIATARCVEARKFGDEKASELVWRGVVLPILMGWEYADMPLAVHPDFDFGNARYVQRPPAIARPVTLVRNAAWYGGNVSSLQASLVALDAWSHNAQVAVSSAFTAIGKFIEDKIIEPIKEPLMTAGKWGLVVAGVGAFGAVVWLLGRR